MLGNKPPSNSDVILLYYTEHDWHFSQQHISLYLIKEYDNLLTCTNHK